MVEGVGYSNFLCRSEDPMLLLRTVFRTQPKRREIFRDDQWLSMRMRLTRFLSDNNCISCLQFLSVISCILGSMPGAAIGVNWQRAGLWVLIQFWKSGGGTILSWEGTKCRFFG